MDLKFYYITETEKEEKKHRVYFLDFVKEYQAHIPKYSKIYCEPVPPSDSGNKYLFNTWVGFKACDVGTPDMTKVNKWLNYIREIWANNNEEYYQYFISWLYLLLGDVGKKPGVAVFAYSPEQGVGKNTFMDFLGT